MNTILDTAIGDAEIVKTECVNGPRGGIEWTIYTLTDGRIALRGPWSSTVPKWIQQRTGKMFIHAGGTTYKWSGFISI